MDKQRHHAREDPKMAHLGPKLDDRPLYGLAKVQGSIGALTAPFCLPSACLLLAFGLSVARTSLRPRPFEDWPLISKRDLSKRIF